MEWTAPVNDILFDEITKINYTLIPPSFQGDVRSVRVVQESLSRVIDELGEQSATAQGLKKVITTGEKLRNTPTYFLYLMKDAAAKGGKGEVIGLLKVGRKHLFLFDEQNKLIEVEPLCVLDFYIQKDRQRHGYGKILFDHMLQDNNAVPKDLAIDGPSQKMEQFMRKNYGIDRLIRQNNNFAISPDFFKTDVNMKPTGRFTPAVTPATVGRFAATKRASTIGMVIHGDGNAGGNAGLKTTTNGNASNGVSHEHEPQPEPQPEPEPEVPEPEQEVQEEPERISPERPSTLSVEPITDTKPGAPTPAETTMSRRDSQLTDRGYFDVKFYHNKIW